MLVFKKKCKDLLPLGHESRCRVAATPEQYHRPSWKTVDRLPSWDLPPLPSPYDYFFTQNLHRENKRETRVRLKSSKTPTCYRRNGEVECRLCEVQEIINWPGLGLGLCNLTPKENYDG